MNKIEKVVKKFERYGFSVENVGTSSWGYLQRYEANKGDFLAGFSYDGRTEAIGKYKFKHHPNDEWTHVANPTIILREAGAMRPRKVKNESPAAAKARLLRRWFAGLSINDEELLSLDFHTHNDVHTSMQATFPSMTAYRRRETIRSRQKRQKLDHRCNDLWNRLIQIHKEKYPDQAPLRKIRVVATVENSADFRLDYSQTNQVAGDMPVFAWNSHEATSTVKMMLGELATVQDFGVIAIGTKEEALIAFNSMSRNHAIDSVKDEIKRQNRNLQEAEQAVEVARKRLEFSKQKMDLASFIDGISNMTSMLSHAI